MDLEQLSRSRRTVHNYKTDQVADSLVHKALELSLWAPNHKLTFPWVFFRAGEKARHALADLSVELKSAKKALSETECRAARELVTNPSHLIFLGLKRDANPERDHENFATLAASVQIATLFLWEHGVATKWTTGGFTRHARTYEILKISQDEIRLEGALMIGIAAIIPPTPARPPLENFLRVVE